MFRGILLVFTGACSFGILSTFVKLAYKEGFSLGEVTGVQVFFGFLMLWALALGRQLFGFGSSGSSTSKDKLKLILLGTSTGLVSLFYYKCVQLVPASVAILLLMQFTWMTLLLDSLLHRRLPTRLQLLTVLFVLLGTAMAGKIGSDASAFNNWAGIGFGLAAAACYTVFLLVSGTAGKNFHPTTRSALIMTGSCLIVFSIFPPVFLVNGALTAGLWKWGLIISVFGTVIPPLFYAYGIPRTGVSLSGILSAAELPVAVLMSAFVLKEQVQFVQWLGVFIILAAIVVSNLLTMRKQKHQLKTAA